MTDDVDRVVSDRWQRAPRCAVYRAGDHVRVRGERGVFRFVRHVRRGEREWVELVELRRGAFRAFQPERIAGRARKPTAA